MAGGGAPPGRGGLENNHSSTNVNSTTRMPRVLSLRMRIYSACAFTFTLEASHASILVRSLIRNALSTRRQ